MRRKYKFEDVAVVGERVRSYDFRGRTDCYVEGVVQRLDVAGADRGYAALIVAVDVDVFAGKVHANGGRVGDAAYVPMEVAFLDYGGRVVNLSRPAQVA